MAYRAVHQLESCLDSPLSYILDLFRLTDAFNLGIRTEFQIYLVCVIYHFPGKILADKIGQVSPYLVA